VLAGVEVHYNNTRAEGKVGKERNVNTEILTAEALL
jgi:hypothetical protein